MNVPTAHPAFSHILSISLLATMLPPTSKEKADLIIQLHVQRKSRKEIVNETGVKLTAVRRIIVEYDEAQKAIREGRRPPEKKMGRKPKLTDEEIRVRFKCTNTATSADYLSNSDCED